jgi:hypothetical protein
MSLTSMADREISSSETNFLAERMRPRVSAHVNSMLQSFNITPAKATDLTENLLPLATETPVEPTKGSNALDSLARYIPTEAITLYVAACSAMASLKEKIPANAELWVYWIFVVLTPILFLVIFMGKRRSAGLSALPAISKWPWWKLVAATIAFGVWALAVPTGPYSGGEVSGIVAAFCALFVSTILTLFEPIFEPK